METGRDTGGRCDAHRSKKSVNAAPAVKLPSQADPTEGELGNGSMSETSEDF